MTSVTFELQIAWDDDSYPEYSKYSPTARSPDGCNNLWVYRQLFGQSEPPGLLLATVTWPADLSAPPSSRGKDCVLHLKKQYPKGMLEYESADEPQTISGIYFSPDLFAANRSPEEPVLLSLPTE